MLPSRKASFIKGLISVFCSYYITLLLELHFSIPNLYLPAVGLITYILFTGSLQYLIQKVDSRSFNKPFALLSIALASLLLIASPRFVNPSFEADTYALIKVTALGEKNDSARANEVWIGGIQNNGHEYDVERIPLTAGWEKREKTLLSWQQQPASLEIRIVNPVKAGIVFQMHTFSGKVEIEEGGKSMVADLYKANPAGTYTYTSTTFFEQEKKFTGAEKFFLTALSFLALSICWYLLLFLVPASNKLFLLTVPLCLALFFLSDIIVVSTFARISLLLLSIGTFLMVKNPKGREFSQTFIKPNSLLFACLVAYASFAFIGQQLFFSEYPGTKIWQKLAYFLLFGGWLSLIAVAYLYLTWLCKLRLSSKAAALPSENNHHSPVKLYFIFLVILLAGWSLYLAAFYPAIMTSDSVDQWGMATGVAPLYDAHPVFHTLLTRLLLSITPTPVILAISQMLFLGAVCSSFLLFLYKGGIPLKWLILFTVVLAIIPTNGLLVVTLWKDIPFACAILWLTLVIAELATKKYLFNYKTTLVCLTASLITVALLRHNGILTTLILAAILLFIAIKERNKDWGIAISLALIGVFGFKIVLPKFMPVTPMARGIQLAPPIHGIASAIYYDGELSAETKQEMEKILTVQEWKKYYYPYSADNYFFRTNTPFINNLSKVPASKALGLYSNTFINNPYLLIRDRLSGSELLWNVSQANDAFNGRFATILADNPFGLKQQDIGLKKYVMELLDFTIRNADSLFWRAGIYNVLLLFLILLFKHRKRYLLILVPLIGNNISLVLAMTHQDFRYVYYVPLLFGFIWLLTASTILSIPTPKNTPTKIQ